MMAQTLTIELATAEAALFSRIASAVRDALHDDDSVAQVLVSERHHEIVVIGRDYSCVQLKAVA